MVKFIIKKKVLPKHMKKKHINKIYRQIDIIEHQYSDILKDPLYDVYDDILEKLINLNIINIR